MISLADLLRRQAHAEVSRSSMSIIVVQVLKSLQLTPRQAIKLCAHGLVNEIHEIETAKHFIYRHSNLPR